MTQTQQDIANTIRHEEWSALQKLKKIYGTLCIALHQITGAWVGCNMAGGIRYDNRKEIFDIRSRLRDATGGLDLATAMGTLAYRIETKKVFFKPVDYRPVEVRQNRTRETFISQCLESYPKSKGSIRATHDPFKEGISPTDKQTILISRMWIRKVLDAGIVTSTGASWRHPNITTHARQIASAALREYGLVAYEASTIRMHTKTKNFSREDGFIVLRPGQNPRKQAN